MKLHTRLQKSFKLCYPIIIPTIVFFLLTHLLAVIQRFSKNSMEYISIATNWIMNLKICIFSPFSFIMCYHYMVMLSLNVNSIATLASKYAQKKKKYSVFEFYYLIGIFFPPEGYRYTRFFYCYFSYLFRPAAF